MCIGVIPELEQPGLWAQQPLRQTDPWKDHNYPELRNWEIFLWVPYLSWELTLFLPVKALMQKRGAVHPQCERKLDNPFSWHMAHPSAEDMACPTSGSWHWPGSRAALSCHQYSQLPSSITRDYFPRKGAVSEQQAPIRVLRVLTPVGTTLAHRFDGVTPQNTTENRVCPHRCSLATQVGNRRQENERKREQFSCKSFVHIKCCWQAWPRLFSPNRLWVTAVVTLTILAWCSGHALNLNRPES